MDSEALKRGRRHDHLMNQLESIPPDPAGYEHLRSDVKHRIKNLHAREELLKNSEDVQEEIYELWKKVMDNREFHQENICIKGRHFLGEINGDLGCVYCGKISEDEIFDELKRSRMMDTLKKRIEVSSKIFKDMEWLDKVDKYGNLSEVMEITKKITNSEVPAKLVGYGTPDKMVKPSAYLKDDGELDHSIEYVPTDLSPEEIAKDVERLALGSEETIYL